MKPYTHTLTVRCTFGLIMMLLAMLPATAQQAAAPPAADSQPLVTVGGQAISRADYLARLEIAAGKPVLNKLVYTLLVRQAATRAGVMPTQADVDARLADVLRRNPQAAAQASAPDYREGLTTDIALENLRIKDVVATDAEVAAFYARHQAEFTIPSQVQTTMVVSQTAADAQKATMLLTQGVAPDVIAGVPGLHVAGVNGFNVNMAALPPAERQKIAKMVLAMTPGQVKTLPAEKYFLTFKVKSSRATAVPPLSQIKDQVARQYKLQRAISAQGELAALYLADPPVFSDARYKAYFSDAGSARSSP